MSEDTFFWENIDELNTEEHENILLVGTSIIGRDYNKLIKILQNCKSLKRININCSGLNTKALDELLKSFIFEDGNFKIDLSKIVLSGDLIEYECESFKHFENIDICSQEIDNISEIIDKFPNLKKMNLNSVVIKDISQLSLERIQELNEKNVFIEEVVIHSKDSSDNKSDSYDLNTYIAIRKKIEELVEGINPDLPEKEKFAEVYKRVCKNIVYDMPAAYPKNNEEEKYKAKNGSGAYNLKNGLLEGKCVCAGYSEILRNALAMVGIESMYISGQTPRDGHAWNKVKLDGIWYNVDATWDATQIRLGKLPTHCLKTDEEIRRKDKKSEFKGPECNTTVSRKEIDEIFNGKHLYIGNIRIPNLLDTIVIVKEVVETYKELGKSAKSSIIGVKDKISNFFNKDDVKLLDEGNSSNNYLKKANRNSWSLKNWEISKDEFSKETDEIISEFKSKSKSIENKDMGDKEKSK